MAEDFITQAAARRRGIPRLPAAVRPRPGARFMEEPAIEQPDLELDEQAYAAADEGALVERAARRRRAGVIGGALEAAAAGMTADVGEIPDTREGAVLGGLMKGVAGVGLTTAARRRAESAAAARQADREGRFGEKVELMRMREGMKEDPAEQARRVAEATLPIKERLAKIQAGQRIDTSKAMREIEAGMTEAQRAAIRRAARTDLDRDPNWKFRPAGDKAVEAERRYYEYLGRELNLEGL